MEHGHPETILRLVLTNADSTGYPVAAVWPSSQLRCRPIILNLHSHSPTRRLAMKSTPARIALNNSGGDRSHTVTALPKSVDSR
jgi:hypothetical protein